MSACHVLELFFIMRICHRHKVPGVTEFTFWGQTVDKHIYAMSGLVSAQKKQKAWKEKESDDIRVESSWFADGFDVHCKRKSSQRWLQACAVGRLQLPWTQVGMSAGRTNIFPGMKGRYKSDTHIKTSNWNYWVHSCIYESRFLGKTMDWR